MKTILIIEPVVTELESQMNFCRRNPEIQTVISARDFEQGQAILQDRQVDLILCSTLFPAEGSCQTLAKVTREFPYIPVVAVSDSPFRDQDLSSSAGASDCVKKPFADSGLLGQFSALADTAHCGTVQGIPLHSLLQMQENDAQTCTLKVFSACGEGYIYLEEGTVINAEVESLTGEEAFYKLISWDEVIIDIRYFNGQRPREIATPLISLIMEGSRLKDEQNISGSGDLSRAKPKQKLQQVATAGMRLALNMGQNLSLKFDSLGIELESMLVGMIPDHSLIITTPAHFLVTATEIAAGQVIVVKFNHMEQLFLFRSKICRVLDRPQPLLFLEYPSVIHFHDIRKAERTAASFPCLLKTGSGKEFNGVFRDISSSGALVNVAQKDNDAIPDIDIKQPITLCCSLPELSEQLEITGLVKNFKKDAQGIQVGVEFSTRYPLLEQAINRNRQSD